MLRHIPGATNSKADILSHLPWYKAELPPPNDVTMLPDSRFIKRTTPAATLLRDEQFLEGGAKTIAIHSSLEEHVRQNRQKETTVTELEKQKHTYSRQKQAYYYLKDESTFHLIPKYGKKSSMTPTMCQLQDIQASSRRTVTTRYGLLHYANVTAVRSFTLCTYLATVEEPLLLSYLLTYILAT
jgi:hypothetical protein